MTYIFSVRLPDNWSLERKLDHFKVISPDKQELEFPYNPAYRGNVCVCLGDLINIAWDIDKEFKDLNEKISSIFPRLKDLQKREIVNYKAQIKIELYDYIINFCILHERMYVRIYNSESECIYNLPYTENMHSDMEKTIYKMEENLNDLSNVFHLLRKK